MKINQLPTRMQAYLAVAKPTTLTEDVAWAEKARGQGVPEVIIERTLAGRSEDRQQANQNPVYIDRLLAVEDTSVKGRAFVVGGSNKKPYNRARSKTTLI